MFVVKKAIASRLSEELVKKVDRAVSEGRFKSRSEALRSIIEEYLTEHPELFLNEGIQELLAKTPALSDEALDQLGSRIFKNLSVAKFVAEGRK